MDSGWQSIPDSQTKRVYQTFTSQTLSFDQISILSETASSLWLSLVKKKKMQGLKGLKDEILILHNILQKLYDSKSRFFYLVGLIIEICFRNFTNHAAFFVFQKK